MDEIKKSLQALVDRATGKVSGTFIFAWLLINWKIPLVLVFDYKESSRLEFIETYLSVTAFYELFTLPALLTVLYFPSISFLRALLEELERWFFIFNQQRIISVQDILREEQTYGSSFFQINRRLHQTARMYQSCLMNIRAKLEEGTGSESQKRLLKIVNQNLERGEPELNTYKMFDSPGDADEHVIDFTRVKRIAKRRRLHNFWSKLFGNQKPPPSSQHPLN